MIVSKREDYLGFFRVVSQHRSSFTNQTSTSSLSLNPTSRPEPNVQFKSGTALLLYFKIVYGILLPSLFMVDMMVVWYMQTCKNTNSI